MSQTMKCVQATYSDFRSQWAVTRRNRKTTAINGRSSLPLQPNRVEYTTPSSRRRKRSASKESEEGDSRDGEEREDGEEGASKDNEEGAGNRESSSTLISFEKVLARGSVHTAGCCRLSLPRAFCERYNVESHVTMTDSTGGRLWHMRFQSCGVVKLSRPSVYTISNGWREFSYDHSLKVNDRVVFTLLSTSHFLVEFATSNGSSRSLPSPLLQRNRIVYTTPSSRRRKRSASKESDEGASRDGEEREDGEEGASKENEEGASKDNDEGASKDNEEGAGNRESSSTLISFEKVLARGSVHTAGCCRLSLPRTFCERYNVESHVTMTDSTGGRLWHMRFQSCGVAKLSRPSVYTISNGWREFSYDHSLKVNDRVVFTLLSTSHFLVEFATSNGSSRAMIPTRDGEDYPWKINYSRLDCLSNANDVDSSQVWLQAMQEKVIRKRMAPIISEEDELREEFQKISTVAPTILQEDEQGVIRIKTVEEVTRKNVAPIKEEEDVQKLIQKSAAPITSEEELGPLSGSRRESPISMPNKQQLQKKMFCQCGTDKVGKGMDTRSDTSWKEYVLPELTHLECKNADGSSYLQIVDSDSEITLVDED